jgi:serine/threonine protein kinase
LEQMGKYQLIRKLATGGMAEVFLAKAAGPMGFEKVLVVKRILPHLAEDPQFTEMFLFEAKLAGLLNHANITQIFDFGEEEGSYFIAMEYLDGPNLRVLSRKAMEQNAASSLPVCAKIVSLACEGLAYAHEFVDPQTGQALGLIHRDISTDNILLSRTGGVKVVDFGIAKAANTGHRTKTGILKGKVAYMSPEHLLGKPLDARADIYALGVVLYELVAGQKPFEGDSEVSMIQAILHEPMVEIGERRKDVPADLQRIIHRMLAKDREERYASCRELQVDLERFIIQCGEPVGAFQIADLVKRLIPSPPSGGPEVMPRPGSGPRKEPSGSRSAATVTPPPPTAQPSPTVAQRRTGEMNVTERTEVYVPQSGLREDGAPRKSSRHLAWVVPGMMLLLSGGGYAFWRVTRPSPTGTPSTVVPSVSSASPMDSVPQQAMAVAAPPVVSGDSAIRSSTASSQVAKDMAAPSPGNSLQPATQPPEGGGGQPAGLPAAQVKSDTQATLEVRSTLRGLVRINGKVAGSSPLTTPVEAGRLRVEVSGSAEGDQFDKSQVIEVKPGEARQVSFSIQKVRVHIRGRPDDMKVISLDGQFLDGETETEIYEGRHKLRLTHSPTGKGYVSECDVRPGDKLCKFFVKLGD